MENKVTFNSNKTDFYPVVKKRVDNYFKENKLSKHCNLKMIIKTFSILSLYIVPYLLILSNNFSHGQMLLLAALMGAGVAGIGMSVMHDGNHGAYSGNPLLNKLAGGTLYLLGGNVLSWKINHNILHHTYTNISTEGYRLDEDLEEPTYLRLSPNSPLKPRHKYQHLYAFFLYGLSTLKWVLHREVIALKKYHKLGLINQANGRLGKEICILTATKVLFSFFVVVVPMLVLNLAIWELAIGLFTLNFISGFILFTVFQLAHIVEKADFPEPEHGKINSEWAVHQMATTANFARKNKILSWYVGGLNFQVEHHLFPHVCHVHYPAISEIVKQTAREYNIPYNEYPTFTAAVCSHLNFLKKLGNDIDPLSKVAPELSLSK